MKRSGLAAIVLAVGVSACSGSDPGESDACKSAQAESQVALDQATAAAEANPYDLDAQRPSLDRAREKVDAIKEACGVDG